MRLNNAGTERSARRHEDTFNAPANLQGELAGLSPEKAARRGRTLLNLRCTDVEAGLLGRSLLTLVNNKARARTVHDPLSFGI